MAKFSEVAQSDHRRVLVSSVMLCLFGAADHRAGDQCYEKFGFVRLFVPVKGMSNSGVGGSRSLEPQEIGDDVEFTECHENRPLTPGEYRLIPFAAKARYQV